MTGRGERLTGGLGGHECGLVVEGVAISPLERADDGAHAFDVVTPGEGTRAIAQLPPAVTSGSRPPSHASGGCFHGSRKWSTVESRTAPHLRWCGQLSVHRWCHGQPGGCSAPHVRRPIGTNSERRLQSDPGPVRREPWSTTRGGRPAVRGIADRRDHRARHRGLHGIQTCRHGQRYIHRRRPIGG